MSNCIDRYRNTQEIFVRSKQFDYICKINHFSSLYQGIGRYTTFEGLKVNSQYFWKIAIYKNGWNDGNKGCVAANIYLRRSLLNLLYPPFKFIISIIDKNEKERIMHKSIDLSEDSNVTVAVIAKTETLLDKKDEFLPNDILTLKFQAFYTGEIVQKNTICTDLCSNDHKLNALENIFNKKNFSDVKIITDKKVFYVYKGILANQSPVFAAMFEHDMKENQDNSVNITDFGHEVIQEVLYFMYSGKVNNNKCKAEELLIAADKYDIDQLRLTCEESLIKSLNVETVINLLIFAEKYRAKKLKNSALDFFKSNTKEITQSEQYKTDIKNLLSIVPEIIDSLIS